MHDGDRHTGYVTGVQVRCAAERVVNVGTYLLRGSRRARWRKRDCGGGYRSCSSLRGGGRGSRSRRRHGDGRATLPVAAVELVLRTGEEADKDGAQEKEDESSDKQEFGQWRQRLLNDGCKAVEVRGLFALFCGGVVGMGGILEERGRLWMR